MEEKSVIIVLGDKCSAKCKVCCTSCSPQNSNIISEDLVKDIIAQTKEDGIADTIGFSGGEPFMHYDLLKSGLDFAKEMCLKTMVYTNAFWGAWGSEDLEKISALPINVAVISTDYYHEEYVPEPVLKNALTALSKAGIAYVLKIGETKSCGADTYFQGLGSYKTTSNLIICPFVRKGRAEELPDDEFYRLQNTDVLCCVANGKISVRYDGEVFPCAEFVTYDTSFSIGNVYKNTLSEILEKNNRFISEIQTRDNLGRIAGVIKSKFGITLPEKCGSGCEVCHMLFRNSELRDYINNGLVEYDKI